MSRFQSSIATLRALEKAAVRVALDRADDAGRMADDATRSLVTQRAALILDASEVFRSAAADLEQQQAAENGKVGQ